MGYTNSYFRVHSSHIHFLTLTEVLLSAGSMDVIAMTAVLLRPSQKLPTK